MGRREAPTESPKIVVRKSFEVELVETSDTTIHWEGGVLQINQGDQSIILTSRGAYEELQEALQEIWYELPDEDEG